MKAKIVTIACIALCLVVFASTGASPGMAENQTTPEPSALIGAEPVITPEVLEVILTTAPTAEPVVIEATPEPTPEPGPPHPFEAEEIVMLAQTIHEEANVLVWCGERYGVSYRARQAAVAWCALNRLDNGRFGSTLAEVLSRPNQFAYKPGAPVLDELLELAEDVCIRWYSEKQGGEDVGRTLPSDYLFFEGDGRENHFRKTYKITGMEWDWEPAGPVQGGVTYAGSILQKPPMPV